MSCFKLSVTFYCELLKKQHKRNKVYRQNHYCHYSTILTNSEIVLTNPSSEMHKNYVHSNLPIFSQYTVHNLSNTLNVIFGKG